MNILLNIDVDDLPRAEAFYTQAFGLRVSRRFGADGVELQGATAPVYLLKKASGSAATPASGGRRDYARHWTPVHMDVVVDDVDAAVARAVAAGAVVEQPARTANWGRIALLADPFGHGFCLVQFLNRGYDEVSTRI